MAAAAGGSDLVVALAVANTDSAPFTATRKFRSGVYRFAAAILSTAAGFSRRSRKSPFGGNISVGSGPSLSSTRSTRMIETLSFLIFAYKENSTLSEDLVKASQDPRPFP